MKMSTYYCYRENKFDKSEKKVEFSKSFMKELKNQLSHILKNEIGEVLDLDDLFISIHSLPNHDSISKESNLPLGIHYYSCHGVYCKLHWRDIEGKQLFSYTDEIPPNGITFRIEDLDVEYFKSDLIKNSYLRGKKVITEYRFVVELKKIETDVYFKILTNNPVTEDLADSLETALGSYIASYNDQSKQQGTDFSGIIHSFSRYEFKKKDNITFKIDLGSGVDIGLKYLFKQYNERFSYKNKMAR